MEWLGGAGIAVAVFGFAIALVGFLVVIVRVRDDQRRTAGLRIVFGGMAATALGMSLFVLSRPAEKLPWPLNLAFALVFLAVSARMFVAAALLRPPRRG